MSPCHTLGVLPVLLWRCCYAGRVVFATCREPQLLHVFTLEVHIVGISSAYAAAASDGGMDLGTWRWCRACMSSPPNMPQHSGAGTERDINFWPFFWPGTGLYSQLAWPWTLTSPLLCQRVLLSKSWLVGGCSSGDFLDSADCSSWELRLCLLPPDLGGWMSLWHRRRFHHRCVLHYSSRPRNWAVWEIGTLQSPSDRKFKSEDAEISSVSTQDTYR